ncbi:MAG: KTSC domain-containing protein [Magnetococcus sp. THC-1_WYH]
MERVRVQSSNLKSIGYDISTSTLEVEFTNCRVYQYFNVSVTVCEQLLNAYSKGSYFSNHIKNRYRFRQIRG